MENKIVGQGLTPAVKKLFSLMLAIVMLFCITAGIDLSAYAETSGDFEYVVSILNKENASISKYNGSKTAVSIPATIDGYTVTGIADRAFSECQTLKSVVIPAGVKTIGSYAFNKCSSLTSVTIPNTVVSIGTYAFSNCESLARITLPDSITNISAFLFQYCGKLTNVEIPNTVTRIGASAFLSCKSLASITLPDSVTSIGIGAFSDCVKLKNIVLPSAVKYIEADTFRGCNVLNSVTMTNNIARIGIGAFASCDSLSEVRYNGTKENWGAISVGSDNDKLINATVYCSDGIINCKHKYDAGKVTKQATCSVAGVKTYTCSVCKGTKTETISAKGHSYDAGKVTKQATCSVAGVKTYTCSVCKGTKTETIKALAHKAVTDEAVAATCTKTGLTEGSHCSECNATITAQETVPAKGHNYKTTTTKATAKANGSVVKKCSVCGVSTKTTVYSIKTIALSKTSYVYNGKAQKPTVTVKDSKGKKISASNYTVSYASGRKNVGKATVTITFKGNYSGTVKKTFTINPKPTTLSSITAKSKGFTAKWKKLTTQITGYQIQYSTSSKFSGAKTVTVSKNKTTSKTISKLKSKKKYYVRIRTYKTVKVNGKSTKIYSSWSKSKSIKTK